MASVCSALRSATRSATTTIICAMIPRWPLLAGKLEARRKSCAPVAGKSTLNRLEQALPRRCRALPPDRPRRQGDRGASSSTLFLDAHTKPLRRIVLDLDATDDPLHGHQEGRFFHGYYDTYCYLPLYITFGRHLHRCQAAPAPTSMPRPARWRSRTDRRADPCALAEGQDHHPEPTQGSRATRSMSWCEENRV